MVKPEKIENANVEKQLAENETDTDNASSNPNCISYLWNHPAGPKTIFFWAPAIKWALVIGGLKDILYRSDDLISIPQSVAILLTGLIWSRYAVVIIPKNYSLLAVNLCVFIIHSYECFRASYYRITNKKLIN